jgi:tetratricopeptide (TPR) repeat protein
VPGRELRSSALYIVYVGLLAFFSPIPVMAQSGRSGPPDEARAVFLRATELYESRSYARAELEFRRAWELMEGHPRRSLVLVNIGRCVESQPGREAEALELYEQALTETNALATQDPGIRDARRIAEERIAELNARIAARGPEERSES